MSPDNDRSEETSNMPPELQQTLAREDERWSSANQIRDWIILIVIGALYLAWMLVIFFLERGIR